MNNIENIHSDINIDMISIYKMSFIYNSILNGWTVRKLENNKYSSLPQLNSRKQSQ